MRKKDKFIFYFFGLISPLIFVFFWIILSVFIVSTTTIIFGNQSIGFFVLFVLFVVPTFLIFFVTKLHGNAIKKYKSLGGKISKGFFNIIVFCWWIISFAVVSAVLLPAFQSPRSYNYSTAVKNGLANGVKECVIRASDDQTTVFADAQSFPGNYNGYTVTAVTGTCYSALATNTANPGTEANFTISLAPATGVVTKTCSVASAPGCSAAGDW